MVGSNPAGTTKRRDINSDGMGQQQDSEGRYTSKLGTYLGSIPMEWDSNATWKRQIERTLNRLGSMVTGNQKFQADRIAEDRKSVV